MLSRTLPLFLITVAGLTNLVQAQATTAPTTRAARPAQTPVLSDKTILRADVPYGGVGDKLEVMDVYSPREVTGAPILLFVHGGEWSRGDKHDVSTKPKFLNENGVVFVAVNYRLSPTDKHPAQVDDVATSIAFVRSHAAEYGGDPSKIVIMGHSAGCHLVTLVGLDPEYLAKVNMKPSDLRGVIAWSGGMYDLVSRANGTGMYPPFIKATFGEAADGQKAASPMTYVDNAKGGPPFLFASVDDDRSAASREISQTMVNLINEKGGKAEPTILAGKSHFTANHEIGAPDDKTGALLLQFINSVTK